MHINDNTAKQKTNPRVKKLSEIKPGTVFRWWWDCNDNAPYGPTYIKTSMSQPFIIFNCTENCYGHQNSDTNVYIYPDATLHLND